MEIDANRNRREVPDICRRCGKPGHWAKDCPRRFDIRFMTVDEKSELLQGLALETDKVELESHTGVDEKEEETQDF
jgi:hypothetical protein